MNTRANNGKRYCTSIYSHCGTFHRPVYCYSSRHRDTFVVERLRYSTRCNMMHCSRLTGPFWTRNLLGAKNDRGHFFRKPAEIIIHFFNLMLGFFLNFARANRAIKKEKNLDVKPTFCVRDCENLSLN